MESETRVSLFHTLTIFIDTHETSRHRKKIFGKCLQPLAFEKKTGFTKLENRQKKQFNLMDANERAIKANKKIK